MISAKVNIGAVGEGLGADGLIHLPGIPAGMDVDMAEVHAEPRLHIGAHRVRQGTAVSFTLTDQRFDIGSSLKAFSQSIHRFGLDRFGFLLLGFGLSLQGLCVRSG